MTGDTAERVRVAVVDFTPDEPRSGALVPIELGGGNFVQVARNTSGRNRSGRNKSSQVPTAGYGRNRARVSPSGRATRAANVSSRDIPKQASSTHPSNMNPRSE